MDKDRSGNESLFRIIEYFTARGVKVPRDILLS